MLPDNPNYAYAYKVLKYYCGLNSPQFALQIEGKWGCGKTWFLNKFIEEYKESSSSGDDNSSCTFFYISLFGMARIEHINIAIAEQLLETKVFKNSPKINKLVAPVTRYLYKFFNKQLYIDEAISSLGAILQSAIEKMGKIIFVFDDFERCNIDHYEIMGYISKLLIEFNKNVIIVANSDYFIGADERASSTDKKFLLDKEKIICLIVNIKSDPQDVLDSLTVSEKYAKIKPVLTANRDLILGTFKLLETDNLRHLEKLCVCFLFLYDYISHQFRSDKKFISAILQTCLIMIAKGFGNKEFYNETFGTHMHSWPTPIAFASPSDAQKENMTVLKRFYGKFYPADFAFTPAFWMDLLCDGKIDNAAIENYYNFTFNAPGDSPIPMQLIHVDKINSRRAQELLPRMEKQILDGEYEQIGLLLHSFGVLIFYTRIGVLNKPLAEIMALCEKAIAHTSFKIDESQFDMLKRFKAWGGYTFLESDSQEFKDLYGKAIARYAQMIHESDKKVADTFLGNISHNILDAANCLMNQAPSFRKLPLQELDPAVLAADLANIADNTSLSVFMKPFAMMLDLKLSNSGPGDGDSIAWCTAFQSELLKQTGSLKTIDPLVKCTLESLAEFIGSKLQNR